MKIFSINQSDLMSISTLCEVLAGDPHELKMLQQKFFVLDINIVATINGNFSKNGCIARRVDEYVRCCGEKDADGKILCQLYLEDSNPAAGQFSLAGHEWIPSEELHHAFRD